MISSSSEGQRVMSSLLVQVESDKSTLDESIQKAFQDMSALESYLRSERRDLSV